MVIEDKTDTNLINLRRSIYLTIMSSLDFEECAHKLLQLRIPEGRESELCNMLIECCSQERTYLRFFGLLGHRFCMINYRYQTLFDEAFQQQVRAVRTVCVCSDLITVQLSAGDYALSLIFRGYMS